MKNITTFVVISAIFDTYSRMEDSTFSHFSEKFPISEIVSLELYVPSVKTQTQYKQFQDWFESILYRLSLNDPSLISLDFTDKKINTPMAEALAIVLQTNTSLENLILDKDNPIYFKGAIAIAKAIKTNNTLKFLSIEFNPIGIHGIDAIVDMLTINTGLTHVYLTNEYLFPFTKSLHKLVNIAKTNKRLVNLQLTRDVGIDDLRSLELENMKDITSMQLVEWY